MRGRDKDVTQFARLLRREQTDAEARLWARLRNRGVNGHKFTRQEPIGQYFTDFVCRDRKLVVEIDGATHSTEAELAHDRQRTACLMVLGYEVLRFNNEEIYRNLEGVLETNDPGSTRQARRRSGIDTLMRWQLKEIKQPEWRTVRPLTPALSPQAGRGGIRPHLFSGIRSLCARLPKRVSSASKLNSTVPVGPWRCLPMMSSALPWARSISPCQV